MANQNKELQLSEENFDFDELEKALEQELDAKTLDLELATKDKEKIGNPESLAETVGNVVWEQFINQIGIGAGEEFIKQNKGLELDLSYDAHIQTAENFAKGKIAEHNFISKEQLNNNLNRYQNMPHSKFRKNFVDPKMDSTLQRVGKLKDQGIKTVTDIYTGRQIPTETKLEDGRHNPKAAQREHVKSSAELYENTSLQMAYSDKELASVINNPENLQGYTTAERNNRKSDKSSAEMEDRDKNKHWEKANERAEEYISKKEKEGEIRLIKEGCKTWVKEGAKAIFFGLLASLLKNILTKLVILFKSGKRKFKEFILGIKDAVYEFFYNLRHNFKETLKTSSETFITTITTAISDKIKKFWMFLKQGFKSLKEAFDYIVAPENKNKPFDILVLEVGKILVAGLSVAGAIALNELIENALLTVPFFALQIPLLGTLASIISVFLSAVVSGIIGALAIRLIDKLIAGRQKELADQRVIEAGNQVLAIQSAQIEVAKQRVADTREKARTAINARHAEAGEFMKKTITDIHNRDAEIFNNEQDRQTTEEIEDNLRLLDELSNQ